MIDETILEMATLLNEGGDSCVGCRKGKNATRKISKGQVCHEVNKER